MFSDTRKTILFANNNKPKNFLDPDAKAFLDATGITNATITTAINTLVKSLKANNLWNNLSAIYPFVTDKTTQGDMAFQMKFNLKDPRNLNAAFRLQFSGGWTYSANGVLPNGINTYADTFLISNSLGQNNFHVSYYSRTQSLLGLQDDIGVYDGQFGISMYTGITTAGFNTHSNSNTVNNIANSNTLGFFAQSRIASSQFYLRARGTTNTLTRTSQTPRASNFILSKTGNFNGEYSRRQLAFATIGLGLTITDIVNLETACNNFQTTLGRNV
jgi:hypothetical protein